MRRRVGEAGLALIRRFEGFAAEVYVCPGGYASIGYGHVLARGEESRFVGGITREQAEALLREDVSNAEAGVLRLVPVALTQERFDALVSFTFNVGAGALQRSTLRRRVLRGNHLGAAREFARWVYAGGRRLPGLVSRRRAEAFLYAASG